MHVNECTSQVRRKASTMPKTWRSSSAGSKTDADTGVPAAGTLLVPRRDAYTPLFLTLLSCGRQVGTRRQGTRLANRATGRAGATRTDAHRFRCASDPGSWIPGGDEGPVACIARALIAIGTGQSRYRYLTEFWRKSPKELDSIWARTRKGVERSGKLRPAQRWL